MKKNKNTRIVPVADHFATRPRFWSGRSTAFFANLLALFFGNEEETKALGDEVGQVDSYGGRLIPVLNLLYGDAENLLILEREPDSALCEYFSADLNLTLPALHILSHHHYAEITRLSDAPHAWPGSALFGNLQSHSCRWIDGYVTDDTLVAIARHVEKSTISSGDGSRLGNNKFLLHTHLKESGLPVFETVLAEKLSEVASALRELRSQGYEKAVLKAQVGASGIGLLKVGTGEEPDVPPYFFFAGPCMVQGWLEPGIFEIDTIRSPSVQMFLDDDTVSLFDITEQILSSDSIHEGNESPPLYLEKFDGLRDELLLQAGLAGRWLHAQGYRGTASTDFLLIERDGEICVPDDVIICEINARVTGATYPSMLARHFHPDGAWLMRNLRFEGGFAGEELLSMLRKKGHLYVDGALSGIIPVNFNFGESGLIEKGQFLCLGSSIDHCHRLLDIARNDLPVASGFDRD